MASRKIELTIEGDYNDADHVSETTIMTLAELENYVPLIHLIRRDASNREFEGHIPFDLSEDELDNTINHYVALGIDRNTVLDFINICPSAYDGDCPIHTLIKISWVFHAPKKEEVLFEKSRHFFYGHNGLEYTAEAEY